MSDIDSCPLPRTISLPSFVQFVVAVIALLSIYLSPIHLSTYLLLLLYVICLYKQLSVHYLFVMSCLVSSCCHCSTIHLPSIYPSISYYCSLLSVSIDSCSSIFSLSSMYSSNIPPSMYLFSVFLHFAYIILYICSL